MILKKTIFVTAFMNLIISCGTPKEESNSDKLSKEDIELLDITSQKKYLNQNYSLSYEVLNEMSQSQYEELKDFHLKGVFDDINLPQAWKEIANLNDEDSQIYLNKNFPDIKNIDTFIYFYGPMFFNK